MSEPLLLLWWVLFMTVYFTSLIFTVMIGFASIHLNKYKNFKGAHLTVRTYVSQRQSKETDQQYIIRHYREATAYWINDGMFVVETTADSVLRDYGKNV